MFIIKRSQRNFAFLWLFMLPLVVFSEDVDLIEDAIFYGTPSVELRLGFEYSSTNDTTSAAKGLNLRSRLGYRTADYLDTNIFVQFHSLANLVEEFSFPGGRGGDLDKDVIADPDGERVHQGYIEYKRISNTLLRLGRQEITLNDGRLIGNFDGRQNGQSFDALTLAYQPIPEVMLYGAVVNQVNNVELTHTDLEHLILLNSQYSHDETHNFSLFTYLLDDENDERDSATYGFRVDGLYNYLIRYDVSYAWQGDYQEGDNHAGEMIKGFLGLDFDLVNFGLGYSRLSGKELSKGRTEDKPFDTLFGSSGDFNGWADQFAVTDGGQLFAGLEDVYFQIGTELMQTRFLLRLHLFDTVENEGNRFNEKYGEELNFEISRDLTDELTFQLRVALFNGNIPKETPTGLDDSEKVVLNSITDEKVFWARLHYRF